MHLISQQPVDKQRPSLYILNLIKKHILEIAIYLIQYLKHVIQLLSCKSHQPLIVKINICETLSCFDKRLLTKSGLTATTHTYDNLGLRATQVNKIFLVTHAKAFI